MPAHGEPPGDWSTRRTRGSAMRRVLESASRREDAREDLIHSDNWQSPIIVDVVLGSIVFVVGAVLAVLWSPVPGGAIGASGATYVALALRRRRIWAAHRAETDETSDR